MKKWKGIVGIICAALLAGASVIPCMAEETDAKEETPRMTSFIGCDGTVISVENGRLTMNRRIGDYTDELIVNLSEDTKILDAVNGLPVPAENLESGEAIRVYTAPFMTLSLPPITNGVLVLCDVPADAGFPTYAVVDTLTKKEGSDGEYVIGLEDGTSVAVNATTQFLPYLTRNIVTAEDMIPGTPILIWTGYGDSAANKIVIFQRENLREGLEGETAQIADGWKETDGSWYFYEDGELKTGWLLDGGDWYYLNPETGRMQTGFVTLSGKTYYLKDDGRMLTEAAVFVPDANGELHLQ